MYSMVTVVNNKVYLKFPKGIDLKCSYNIHKEVTAMMDMLISLIVVIISQCIHISKHHIIYLKFFISQSYFNKAGKNR